jgi:LysM repeat protein
MSDKDSAQNVIDAYRKKRQQSVPFLVGGLAIVLVAVGIVVLIAWLSGPNSPSFAFRASETPTSTVTPLPTSTATTTVTPTLTPTATLTPTVTTTATAASPFVYKIEENDTLFSIAEKFSVDVLVLMALNKLTFDSVIRVGDELLIPNPDLALDTPTPLPTGFRGVIEYTVAAGDTLEGIANQFNSTVDAIIEETEGLENANEIFVGQVLKVPTNIATPVPTPTPGPGATLTQGATTPAATGSPAVTDTPSGAATGTATP